MNQIRKIIAASVAALTFSTSVFAMDYQGPKFDLSDIQPEFRMGFLGDESSQEVMVRNECLKSYMEAAFNVPVKMYTFKDYAGTMEAFAGGNLDYTWFSASSYAGLYLQNPEAGEPVATREQVNGARGDFSVMLVRADSDIESVADMKGKKLGFTGPNSTSGYLFPSVELGEKLGDFDAYFKATEFTGGHENGVLALLNGDIDATVTWATRIGAWEEGYSASNMKRMVDKGLLNMDDIREIWHSSLIPNGPIVMRKDLPQEAKDTTLGMLQWVLANDKACNEEVVGGKIGAWIPVDHSFYEVVVKARKALIEAQKTN